MNEYLIERYIREEVVVHAESPREAILCATVPNGKDYQIIEPYTQSSNAADIGMFAVQIIAIFILGYVVGFKWKQ